jgi:hypothetical protein
MKQKKTHYADKTLHKFITDWESTQIDIKWLRQPFGVAPLRLAN